MVVIGIDLLILTLYGLLLTLVSYVAAAVIPLTEEQGWPVVTATAITSLAYVIGYAVMAHVFDLVFGMSW